MVMKCVIKFLEVQQAICSHGRSYEYFTESLASAATSNCTFWAHRWDLTYRHLSQTMVNPCDNNTCTEMGIRAELYNEHGTFYVATASSSPFCSKYYSYCTLQYNHIVKILLTFYSIIIILSCCYNTTYYYNSSHNNTTTTSLILILLQLTEPT